MMILPTALLIPAITAPALAEEAEVSDFALEEVLEVLAEPAPMQPETAPWWAAAVPDAAETDLETTIEVALAEDVSEPVRATEQPKATLAGWWVAPAAEGEPSVGVEEETPATSKEIAALTPAEDTSKPLPPKQPEGSPPAWWSAPIPEAGTTEPSDAAPAIDAPPEALTEAPVKAEPVAPDLPLIKEVPPPLPPPDNAERPADRSAPADPLPRRTMAPIAQAVAEAAGLQPQPAEAGDDLGRLQVMLHRDGDLMHITITAERPETLEMMRRHADQLQLELRQEGFAQTDLSFAEWERPPAEEDEGEASFHAPTEPVIFNLPAPQATTGLDIRM